MIHPTAVIGTSGAIPAAVAAMAVLVDSGLCADMHVRVQTLLHHLADAARRNNTPGRTGEEDLELLGALDTVVGDLEEMTAAMRECRLRIALGLYQSSPQPVSAIAGAAGVTDSYLCRLARESGLPPRGRGAR